MRTYKKTQFSDEKKVWSSFGGMFLKLPRKDVEQYLEKDQKTIDKEIQRLRNEVKEKSLAIREIESGQTHTVDKAFVDLKPMSRSEMSYF